MKSSTISQFIIPYRATRVRVPALLAASVLWVAGTSAAILPDEVQQALERQDNAHVQQPGYAPVDLDAPFWDHYYRMLDDWAGRSGQPPRQAGAVSLPDSDMHPIERAVRVLEARDGRLPHVRYHVEYRLVNLPEFDYWEPRTHIQVTRYNLGPIQHRELVAAHGAKNVAPPEEFGIGPHVRWRLAMAPVQDMKSQVLVATRRVLDAVEAEQADCLGTPCLSTQPAQGPDAGWQELDGLPAFAPPVTGSFTDPAAAAGIVAGASLGPSSLGYGEPVETNDATAPQLILLASDGLTPEPAVEVLAHQPMVMDDAVAQMWMRHVETGGAFPSVFWSRLPVHRPGRN